jgi:uncharacterized membrane protein
VSELTVFLGRFHPLLVHFPIALLVLSGALELRAWWVQRTGRRDGHSPITTNSSGPHPALAETTGLLLALGGLSAIISATAGYLLGGSGGYGGPTFLWHERLGIAVAIGATLTWAGWMAAHRSGHDALMTMVYRGLLAATLIVVGIASHLGATLTHGEGYLTEHAPSAMQRWFGLSGSSLASGVTRPDQAVAYSTLVQPILDRRCVSCHGPITAEGKLRLDTLEGIRKGGGDGPVIVPGRASESEIVRRIWLPPSHKHAMPPGGRNYLPPAEAAVIRWWIDQGATGDAKLGELDISADVLPAIEAVVGPVMRGGPSLPDVNVPLADRQAVAAANRLGVSVVPLASGNHFVEVHCTNAGARFGDTELATIRPLAPQTVWLDLSGTCITDAGLATVAGFRNLTRLHLNHTRVSDDGLKQLVSLQHLEYLNLYGTAVTDAGLQALARLPKLRTLYVWQTAVSESGLERLKTALPRLEAQAGLALASLPPTGAAPTRACGAGTQ